MPDRDDLRRKVESLPGFPVVAPVARVMADTLKSASLSLSVLERYIGSDPALTAKMLRFANSTTYGFPEKIASLSHALILLGIDMIRGLVLSTPVWESQVKGSDELRRHSLAVSRVAALLATRAGLKEVGRAAQAGLLHDLGKLVILVAFPKQHLAIGRLVKGKKSQCLEAEAKLLGADHGEIAAFLCQGWNLPLSLIEPIAYHHFPEKATGAEPVAAAVHLADIIVKGAGLGHCRDVYVPPVKEEALHTLGLSFTDLKEVILEAGDELRNLHLLDPFAR